MIGNHKDQLSLSLGHAGAVYEPQYEITQAMGHALDSIDRDRWAFDRLIINPKYEGWLRRRAFIRSGHHTLHLEGNRLSEDQVARVLDNPDADTGPDAKEVSAWNNAMAFIDGMSGRPNIPITSLLIRHINQLILGSANRALPIGEYRRGDAKVRDPVTRNPAYTAPPAGDVPDLMWQFERWLNTTNDIHPVILAGISHLRLVEIHPFPDGNGRTVRCLDTLVLQRMGYSFNSLLALERHFDFDLVNYCRNIGATVGESFTEGRDLTKWLEYYTFALSEAVGLASNEVIDLRRYMENWHTKLAEKGYPERHQDILAYALINRGIRPRDVVKIRKVSSVTASHDLRHLEDQGLLTSEGQGKARIYRVTEDFWQNL